MMEFSTGQIIIGLVVAFIGSSALAAFVTAYFTRPKTQAETLSLQGKTQKQIFENFDFENEVLNQAAAAIKTLRKRELELTEQVHKKDIQIKTLEIEKSEAHGQVKFVLAEKELILQKVDELKEQVEGEKRDCFKKIHELATNHQSQIDFLQNQVDVLTARLQHYESAVDK